MNEFDMSKCPKTVFFVPILDHPSIVQFRPPGGVLRTNDKKRRWGPCAPCTGGGAKHPSIEAAIALERASCDRKSLKNHKNATFSEIVQE